MKYNIIKVNINPDHREAVNTAALSFALGEFKSTHAKKEEIFNLYTGNGGLHGFKPEDFDSFSEFISEKREKDQGQFFTYPANAKEIVEILGVEESAKSLDPTCGSAVFCNFVAEQNFTGVELDTEVCTVAKFLYPKADIRNESILDSYFEHRFDYVISNPPFNFNFNGKKSQLKIIIDSAMKWLKSYGFLAIIVPDNYLEDDLFYSGHIDVINHNYNFVGALKINNAFRNYKLKYKTKVLFLQLKGNSELSELSETYNKNYLTKEELTQKIKILKTERKKWLLSSLDNSIKKPNDFSFKKGTVLNEDAFSFRLKKYLYEVSIQKPEKYEKALQLLNEFKTQKRPPTIESEEWERIKLTPNKVLYRIKQLYSDNKRKKRNPKYFTEHHELQFKPLSDIKPEKEIIEFLENFKFNTDKTGLKLLPHQIEDCSKQLMKPYGILNWEQGTGKTIGAYAMLSYRSTPIKVIVAPAKVIRGMWKPFLEANGENYTEVAKPSDMSLKTPIWLMSYSFVRMKKNKPLLKRMKRFLRGIKNNYFVVLDEIHKIKNPHSQTFKKIQATFKNAKYKLGTTGTIVWNSAEELYPILVFLYNHSLIDNCSMVYKQDKDGRIKEVRNDNSGLKFSAYHGFAQFKRCFSPEKTTVFGINKHSQDVYNNEEFKGLITPISSIRTFKEVAGDKYDIKHILIEPTTEEKALYDKIIFDNSELIRNYFENTGNTRKESGLKILRVLTMLLNSTSYPEGFREFEGKISTKILKIKNIIRNVNEYVAIGCTRKKVVNYYTRLFKEWFPEREVFTITGQVPIQKRMKILEQYRNSGNGILICTQQSLEEGLNIEFVNHAFIESMNWNLAKMSQWYFRFIRLTSKEKTTVYFVNYDKSIENNLFALIMVKENIAKIVKLQDENIFTEYGFDESILNHILERVKDDEGKMKISWGTQKFF